MYSLEELKESNNFFKVNADMKEPYLVDKQGKPLTRIFVET